MRCSDYEPIILFMARTTSLKDDRAGQQALAHTKDCNRCAARLAEEEALVAGVRAVVADLAKEQAPARLEETLLTAFRQRGRARGSGRALVPLTRMSRRTQWVLATAAAVIVVGASAIAFLRNQSDQFTRPREAPAIQNERRAGPAQ